MVAPSTGRIPSSCSHSVNNAINRVANNVYVVRFRFFEYKVSMFYRCTCRVNDESIRLQLKLQVAVEVAVEVVDKCYDDLLMYTCSQLKQQ